LPDSFFFLDFLSEFFFFLNLTCLFKKTIHDTNNLCT
jgi:hypothetical protein